MALFHHESLSSSQLYKGEEGVTCIYFFTARVCFDSEWSHLQCLCSAHQEATNFQLPQTCSKVLTGVIYRRSSDHNHDSWVTHRATPPCRSQCAISSGTSDNPVCDLSLPVLTASLHCWCELPFLLALGPRVKHRIWASSDFLGMRPRWGLQEDSTWMCGALTLTK